MASACSDRVGRSGVIATARTLGSDEGAAWTDQVIASARPRLSVPAEAAVAATMARAKRKRESIERIRIGTSGFGKAMPGA
jgi:hypothetical protein